MLAPKRVKYRKQQKGRMTGRLPQEAPRSASVITACRPLSVAGLLPGR